MTSNIVAITLENFQQVVLEESTSKLVLVAFWAAQIPESVELRDKLAASVASYDEHIIIATVDCETQQQVAQQFGIQGLPTAIIVKDGQPIDGLSGPQPDESIKEFLDKHLPKEEDLLHAQAKQLLVEGKANEAFPVIEKATKAVALTGGDRADINLTLVDVYLQIGKVTEAEALLSTIKMIDQDSEYKALMAKLELASQAADSPEIKALEEKLAQGADDIELHHQLAAQYSQVNRHEDALVLLFKLVQKDGSDTLSKELLIDVLKALPDGDPLSSKYRRKLYTLMY